jgi:hypothetical protein
MTNSANSAQRLSLVRGRTLYTKFELHDPTSSPSSVSRAGPSGSGARRNAATTRRVDVRLCFTDGIQDK